MTVQLSGASSSWMRQTLAYCNGQVRHQNDVVIMNANGRVSVELVRVKLSRVYRNFYLETDYLETSVVVTVAIMSWKSTENLTFLHAL